MMAGFSGVLIKNIESISASSIAWFRTAIPSLFVLIWMLSKSISPFRGNYKKMIVGSVMNTLRIYFFLIAFIYTSIGNAVIILYTWPIMVALIGYLFLGEKMGRYQTFLLLLAFSGIVLAYSDKPFTFGDSDFVGMLAALGASIFNALTVILFKSESQNYHSFEMVFYQNFLGVIIFLPFFVFGFDEARLIDFGLSAFYGLMAGIGVFGLFFYGLKHLKATTASTLMYLEILSAIFFGYWFFDEVLSLNMILGGVLIMTSNLLLIRSKSLQSLTEH